MINQGARRLIAKSAAIASGVAAANNTSNSEAKLNVDSIDINLDSDIHLERDHVGIINHENFSPQQPDNRRVIFGPRDSPKKYDEAGTQVTPLNSPHGGHVPLDRKQLTKIAQWEIKDAPKDVLTDMVLRLGEDLAKDKSVQMAVYKKFGISMDTVKDTMGGGDGGDNDNEIQDFQHTTRIRIERELEYLKEELESQQTLNDQLIYHNDRLCEEKIKLKRQLSAADLQLHKERTERRILENKIRTICKNDQEAKQVLENDSESSDVEANQQRNEDKEPSSAWDISSIVVKALAVAAVVILMAIVKKKGVVTVAATSAAGAWSWMRSHMKPRAK